MSERIDDEITFRKLEVLLAFLRAGNLARAAEALELSTVSVHRALHSLEDGLRCQLFRHEGRNLIPTEAAHVLAAAARDAIKLLADGIQATRDVAGYASNRIRIGSLYSLTIATVPRVIIDLKVRRPELHNELVLGSNADLLAKLKAGAIDAALMAVPPEDAEIRTIALFEDDIWFAAPAASRQAGSATVDLRDCADEPFVTLTDGFATYDGFVDAFRTAGYTPNVVTKVGDIFSLMNLVSGGVGCTLLPGRMRSVPNPNVKFIALDARYAMRQTIGLSFMRARERDPNLLALASVCRLAHRERPTR